MVDRRDRRFTPGRASPRPVARMFIADRHQRPDLVERDGQDIAEGMGIGTGR